MFILGDLWRGDIRPNEKSFERESQYAKVLHQLAAQEARLRDGFSKETREAFEAYLNSQMELNGIAIQEAFVQGYQIGAKMVLDVMAG